MSLDIGLIFALVKVTGIWAKYTDTTDINATDAAFAHKVIVTGDDFGLVKLFRFPSVKKGAKCFLYVNDLTR